MTNSWTDIKNADLVLIMGGNAAEAHPVGFRWVVEAMQQRKAKLLVVDPRFTRSAAVADFYAPIRVGTDIAFLGGVINYLLSKDKIHHDYVKLNTDATFLLKPDFKFENGFFSGYDEAKRSYGKASWGYRDPGSIPDRNMSVVCISIQCIMSVAPIHDLNTSVVCVFLWNVSRVSIYV